MRLKETFRCFEAFFADFDHSTIWQLVRLDQHRRIVCQLVLKLRIKRNIAQLLFDLSNCFEIRRSIECVTSLHERIKLIFYFFKKEEKREEKEKWFYQ